MSKNLYQASNQWATRPDDERFASVEEMLAATRSYASAAKTSTISSKDIELEKEGDNLRLVGKSGKSALLTHYSFGQLSRLASAPAEYLRRLDPDLAAQNLRAGFRKADDKQLKVLFHQNGDLVTRAVTTESYDRVWNYEIIERIVASQMQTLGWQVPPARPARPNQAGTRLATEADILPNQGDFGLRVKVGDPIAPAGLYASDHDMFLFLVNQMNPVSDGAKLLNRGVFIQNSEVGDCSLRFKMFTYDNVCGNHIVWGVHTVTDISVRHVKGANVARGKTLNTARSKWQIMSKSATDTKAMETAIAKARVTEIGATKDEVIDAIFAFAKPRSLSALSRSTLDAAYQRAVETPRYGSPRTVWGMVNGLTEVSQTGKTDERTELDTQAGRLMEMTF